MSHEPSTGVIDAEATETGKEDYKIGLYTPDGILFTSEMDCLALQHLASQGKGNMLDEFAKALSAVISAIRDEDSKTGTVTITLKYTDNGDGAIKCNSKVKTSLPERADESVFFMSASGGLSRNRPEDMHKRR